MAASLLLDADLAPAIASQLRGRGYDVVSAREHPELIRLNDDALLAWATQQGRTLVTHNVRDFVELSRQLAHAEQEHAGLVLVHAKTFAQSDVGGIVHALERLLNSTRDNRELRNQTIFLRGAR